MVDGSASRVGIGTATPSTLLDVNGTATATTFVGALTGNVTGTILTAAQTNITSLGTLTGLTTSGLVTLDGSGAFLQVDVGGTQTVRVGSSNHIVGGTDNDAIIQTRTGADIRFYSGSSESMRIDSDGQLFVGDGSPQWPTGTVSNLSLIHISEPTRPY